MRVDLYVHFPDTNSKLDQILQLLQTLTTQGDKMSLELDNLTTEVTNATTVEQSAITLIQGLKSSLDAAGTDPVKLKALSDSLAASDANLAAAIAANTPAAPTS